MGITSIRGGVPGVGPGPPNPKSGALSHVLPIKG